MEQSTSRPISLPLTTNLRNLAIFEITGRNFFYDAGPQKWLACDYPMDAGTATVLGSLQCTMTTPGGPSHLQ